MKSAVIAFAVGSLLLVVSLGIWAFIGPSDELGDAAAVERALTSTTDGLSSTATSSTTTAEPSSLPEPARPDSQASVPRFTIGEHSQGHNRVPIALRIPAIDIKAPVYPSGVDPNGEMEVPGNVTDVGWYKYGPAPGEPGSAVLAAHVDLAGRGPGVFFDLKILEPGDVIYVDFDDGSTETYRAEARTLYDKDDLPTEAIFSREGPEVLTLITCGGGFNRSIRSYDSNVVVYAVPLNAPPLIEQKDQL